MKKINTKNINNGSIELYRTKTGYSVQIWKYYNLQKNTEMYLDGKLTFSIDEKEKAEATYDELINGYKKL
jgi:hypothetical protein